MHEPRMTKPSIKQHKSTVFGPDQDRAQQRQRILRKGGDKGQIRQIVRRERRGSGGKSLSEKYKLHLSP